MSGGPRTRCSSSPGSRRPPWPWGARSRAQANRSHWPYPGLSHTRTRVHGCPWSEVPCLHLPQSRNPEAPCCMGPERRRRAPRPPACDCRPVPPGGSREPRVVLTGGRAESSSLSLKASRATTPRLGRRSRALGEPGAWVPPHTPAAGPPGNLAAWEPGLCRTETHTLRWPGAGPSPCHTACRSCCLLRSLPARRRESSKKHLGRSSRLRPHQRAALYQNVCVWPSRESGSAELFFRRRSLGFMFLRLPFSVLFSTGPPIWVLWMNGLLPNSRVEALTFKEEVFGRW